MITWVDWKLLVLLTLKREIYSKTKIVMQQDEDEMRVSKRNGDSFVSLLSQRHIWSSSLPSESLRFWVPLMFDNFSSHLLPSPPLTPSIPAEVQELSKLSCSPAPRSCTHCHCLLFHFQIQGMTALPPDIERTYKAEPLVCASPSFSLHRDFSPKVLACFMVLGSVLSSLHLGS